MTVRASGRRQMRLAVRFPGVDSTTVWADPRSRSRPGAQVEFSSFEQLARTAERGLFDFFLLAEGLRLRERKGPYPRSGRGRAARVDHRAERARRRHRARLSIRPTVIEAGGRHSFVGTPQPVADGLDEFVDRVVPLLQERGAFRAEYAGTTLRSHLGLSEPVWPG